MKFYQNCSTLEELKAEYKRLAKKYHPDMGGSDDIMAQVNAQYDDLAAKLPKTNAQGETYQPQQRENSAAFRAAVLAVITRAGLVLELCGCWLWCTGDTYTHKDALKAAGYRFSGNKKAWYWHDPADGYTRRGGSSYSLDDIRTKYGSRRVVSAGAAAEELPETA